MLLHQQKESLYIIQNMVLRNIRKELYAYTYFDGTVGMGEVMFVCGE